MNTTVAGRIEIENPTLEVKEFAEKNLILANPKHISNKVYGFSNYNVPEHVKLYGEYSNKLYLPFGVLKKIYPLIKDTLINVVFKPVEAKKLLSPIVLKEYQQNAIDACLKAKNGVLVAPCGSGKTIMGLILATELKQKTLWIVHTKELLNQSLDRAKEIFINYEEKDFGKITEGKVEVGNVMTFATIQTLSKLNLYSLTNEFGCVVIDECFSGDTEILTDKGFVRFDKLNKNEKVAQYENGEITYVKPLRYIEKETDEYVSFKYKNIEIKTTKNHNMVYIDENGKEQIRPAKDFLDKKLYRHIMITKANINISEERLSTLDKIKIMLQADGCMVHKNKIFNEDTYRLDFSKQRKIDRAISLLEEAGIPYKISKPRIFENKNWKPSTKITFHFPKEENNYKILPNFLKQPTNSQYANDILEEVSYWDAYARSDNCIEYDSKIKENADFIKLCAFLSNKICSNVFVRTCTKPHHSPVYRVEWGKLSNWQFDRFERKLIKEKMKVYCVEVPTHKIVVKKDGLIFVCGNCQHVCGGENSRTMYYEVLNELNVRYKYGLTATPKRQGGYEKSMFALLGDICYEVSEQDIKKAGRTCKTIMEVINCPTEDTPYIYKSLTKREKQEGKQRGNIDTISLNSFLPTVAYRNDKIIENIMNNVNGKHHQLVLCDRVDHCKILYNHLAFIQENCELEHPLKVALYIGENKDNKEIRNNYDQYDVIIATYSMAKEGTDMPALDTLHLATPISNNQALKQCVGRVQRYYPAKKESTVYVYRDFNIRFSCRCADLVRQTLKIRKQGYDFSKN